MRNNLFLIISAVTCIIAILKSDLSSERFLESIILPLVAFITLAASLIFFANRHTDND